MAWAGGGAVGPGLREPARGQEVARSSFRRAFPERLLCAAHCGWGAAGHKGCESTDLCWPQTPKLSDILLQTPRQHAVHAWVSMPDGGDILQICI